MSARLADRGDGPGDGARHGADAAGRRSPPPPTVRSLAASGRLAEATSGPGRRASGAPARGPGLSPWPLIHHLVVTAAVAAESGDGRLAEELLAEIDELAPWTDESMGLTRRRIADCAGSGSRDR